MPGVIQGQREGDIGPPIVRVGVANPARIEAGDTILTVPALVDTGASECCLRADLADRLGLAIKPRLLETTGAFMVGTAHPADVVLRFLPDPGAGALPLVMHLEVAVVPNLTEPLMLGWRALRLFELGFAASGTFSLRWYV